MMPRLILWHECECCGSVEERVFTDSWTGLDLCVECLDAVLTETALSPASEGDNLKVLLVERCGLDEGGAP